jgi:glutamate synthase domain-containing protein 3
MEASELANLTINGQTIVVTGEANQTVPLPLVGGVVVINEQDDTFALSLDGVPVAAGFLDGGNIQLHTCR